MPIPREQFKEAYGKLPESIRAYLAGEELGIATEQIGSAHGLHIDAIGVLAEILTRTLLGLLSPQELPAALTNSLGIDSTKANAILSSTNDQIFIPLQKKVREAADREAQERLIDERLAEIDKNSNEPLPVPEQKPEPISAPKIEYAPPIAAASTTLPGSPVPAPMPQQHAPVVHTEEATHLPVPSTSYVPAQVPQHVTTMPAGHAPGWHPAAAVHIFVPSQQHQQPYQTPVVSAPEPTAPALEQAVAPVLQMPTQPQIQPVSSPIASAPEHTTPPTRQYSNDPYREPI